MGFCMMYRISRFISLSSGVRATSLVAAILSFPLEGFTGDVGSDSELLAADEGQAPARVQSTRGRFLPQGEAVPTQEDIDRIYNCAPPFENASSSFDTFDTSSVVLRNTLAAARTFAGLSVGTGIQGSIGLYLTGPTGVGKTHLLKSIQRNCRGQNVVYLLADFFARSCQIKREDEVYNLVSCALSSNGGVNTVVLIDNVMDLESPDAAAFMKDLLLSIFNKGHSKIAIASHLSFEEFLSQVLRCRLHKERDGMCVVRDERNSVEGVKNECWLSRVQSMFQVADLINVPSYRKIPPRIC